MLDRRGPRMGGLLAALAASVICGCATYQPDLSNGAARVRVLVDYPEHTYVRVLDQACYYNASSGVGVTALPNPVLKPPVRVSIGMPPPDLRPKTRFVEFHVAAGTPLRVAIQASGYFGGCNNGVAFTPAAGEDYELQSDQGPTGCVIRARRLTQQGAVPLQVEQLRACKVF